jgi:uncharacterized paraquat-inducible protein A
MAGGDIGPSEAGVVEGASASTEFESVNAEDCEGVSVRSGHGHQVGVGQTQGDLRRPLKVVRTSALVIASFMSLLFYMVAPISIAKNEEIRPSSTAFEQTTS